MSIRETDRTELHLKLKELLGNNMAEVLMEHLPPSGWGDVARKSDIAHLSVLMDARFGYVENTLRGVQHGLWALASLMSACFIATFTILVTQL